MPVFCKYGLDGNAWWVVQMTPFMIFQQFSFLNVCWTCWCQLTAVTEECSNARGEYSRWL
jgi:hypothetical protein